MNSVTTGIIIWNDAFLYTDDRTGEKVAIIVIDTQGLYNCDMVDDSRILSLAALISSTLILNSSGEIENNHLKNLRFANEFKSYASSKNLRNINYFQNLLLWVNNWVSIINSPNKYCVHSEIKIM